MNNNILSPEQYTHIRNIANNYPISCQDFINHYCHAHQIHNIYFTPDPGTLCMIMLYGDLHSLQYKPDFTFCKNAFLHNCSHDQKYAVIKELSAIIIQRQWKAYREIKHNAARIIQRGMHNWLWKPVCKDGTVGINLRLGLKMIKDLNLDR